jgi:hypothetical protein
MWPQHVIARIEGGLGNQLFQYAAARSLADRLQCELLLDVRGLALNGDRALGLESYRIRAYIATDEQLGTLPPWRASRWGRMYSRLSQSFPEHFSYPVFWSESFAYDSAFERISQPAFLVGYWQSERYFSWNRARLLRDISLRQECVSLPSSLQEQCCVAIHVRRGDYVSNDAANAFHGLCEPEYYARAIAQLQLQGIRPHAIVFTDDPQWVRNNLVLGVPTHYASEWSNGSAHAELELMRKCHHHVIANSSFSWWGAWLCQHMGQTVYAPQRWFQDPATDSSDVVPTRWTRL